MISSVNFLPHGMQILPELDSSGNEKFGLLNGYMDGITKELEKEAPNIIILFTPHGLNLSSSFLMYQHNAFEGRYYQITPEDSVVYGDLKYLKQWVGDSELGEKLLSDLLAKNIKMEAVTQGNPDYPLTLAWGETVPLYYLPEIGAKILVIGIPRSRHTDIQGIQGSLRNLADVILDFGQKLDKKVALVFSGDLSHTHIEAGPYGFHESSKPFDELVQKWVKSQSNEDYEKILELQPTALACGMAGMGMINQLFRKIKLENEIVFYELPTYFGMMVSRWLPSR